MTEGDNMAERRIDLIEYGQLIQSVKNLTESLDEHTAKMSTLSEEVKVITERLNTGKGVVFGLMIAAGGLGAGASEAIKHIFGK